MPLARKCTECGGPLTGKQRYTCGDSCRSTRSRRLKRDQAKELEGGPTPQQYLSQVTSSQMQDIVHEVARDELRPVIREALNEEVLEAVQGIVGLTPRVVEAMTEDLYSEDPVIRQRAYTLIVKYTIGHPALGPKPEHEGQQLVVNIGLPRPGADDAPVEDVEHEEFKTCDMCERDQLATEFVDGSDRCVTCFNKQRDNALEYLK